MSIEDKVTSTLVILVVSFLSIVVFAGKKSEERYIDRNCEPVKEMYYKTRSGRLNPVLRCDDL